MLAKNGGNLVCSAITHDAKLSRALLGARHIDRLNFGAIPIVQPNWFQPHEGSIVDFLLRVRPIRPRPSKPRNAPSA